MNLARAEAGAKGGSAVRWRSEPCPVTGPFGLACQKSQTWQGDRELRHHHRWDGEIDGRKVTVIWVDGDSR